MEWRFFNRSSSGTNIAIDFELTPPNEPFYYLIRSTPLFRLPHFLQQVLDHYRKDDTLLRQYADYTESHRHSFHPETAAYFLPST